MTPSPTLKVVKPVPEDEPLFAETSAVHMPAGSVDLTEYDPLQVFVLLLYVNGTFATICRPFGPTILATTVPLVTADEPLVTVAVSPMDEPYE